MRATTPSRASWGPALTFLLCSSGWVALVRPVEGQEPAPRAEREATPDAAPDRRRLLTLADGSVLRLRTRRVEGVWQRRERGEWVPLDREVVGQRLLQDALAEARALEGEIGREDHVRRAELARWMAEQGLYQEAVVELNRVLRHHPEHETALRVVRETHIPLELSDEARRDPVVALKETLIEGAGGTSAEAEIAVRRLAELGARFDLRRVLEGELRVPQPRRRGFAARALRRLYPGQLTAELTRRALLDGFGDVRAEAARALRTRGEVGVILPVIDALDHDHTTVRANAAEALGNLGYEAAVEPLVNHLSRSVTAAQGGGGGPGGTRSNLFAGLQTAYVMDYDVEIAQGASIADPVVNVVASGVVFDVRAQAQITRVVELRRTMGALRKLTGLDLHHDPGRWLEWWEENADQWRAVDRARAFEARKAAEERLGGD